MTGSSPEQLLRQARFHLTKAIASLADGKATVGANAEVKIALALIDGYSAITNEQNRR